MHRGRRIPSRRCVNLPRLSWADSGEEGCSVGECHSRRWNAGVTAFHPSRFAVPLVVELAAVKRAAISLEEAPWF